MHTCLRARLQVCTRMQLLSQGHAARWSLEDPVATARAQAAASTGGALAAAVAADTAKSLPAHLEVRGGWRAVSCGVGCAPSNVRMRVCVREWVLFAL